jgi:xylulokinase
MAVVLGIDLGSSSVKASLLDLESGHCLGSAFYPKDEQVIDSPQPGFAEQDPAMWFANTRSAVRAAMAAAPIRPADVNAVGIAYQMHGLVCVDKELRVLRPAIIWCDSRAVSIGQEAFEKIGPERCLENLLNSPGNFTASKLKWVQVNQPEIFARIHKILLPGDWLAMRLTGQARTTQGGLSEGILWNFKEDSPARILLDAYGFDPGLLAETVPSFGWQGELTSEAAGEMGLATGTPVTYRAGDQPNNALSLNVLQPGEMAATAGTSGVVYGVSDRVHFDPQSRVNTFLHVNHQANARRLGVLLCINGAGILNAWTRRLLGRVSYQEMDALAEQTAPGSEGLCIFPFGNGAERVLNNRCPGARLAGIDFNRHDRRHVCRAVQEGIAFSFRFGMDVMRTCGITPRTIRAGYANMFLSPVFRETLASVSGTEIELYDTDGSLGAARGAATGAGLVSLPKAFGSLKRNAIVRPQVGLYEEVYQHWLTLLNQSLNTF